MASPEGLLATPGGCELAVGTVAITDSVAAAITEIVAALVFTT